MKTVEHNFLYIIIIFSIVAFFFPEFFIWLKIFLPVLLGIIMFGIGLNIKKSECAAVWKSKWIIIFIVLCKYTLVSIAAFALGLAFKLSLPFFIGFVIVGACPGGTAANVMSYLSRKANIALTVVLTFFTTIIAPIAIPLIMYLFLHKSTNIPFFKMFFSSVCIILIPIIAGLLLKKKIYSKYGSKVINFFPTISIFSISLVVACIVALGHKAIINIPFAVIGSVVILNLAGYLLGYLVAKIFRLKRAEQLSIIFEFGILDTGLGVVIATSFFNAIVALPAVFYSVVQNITAPIIIKGLFFIDKKNFKDQY